MNDPANQPTELMKRWSRDQIETTISAIGPDVARDMLRTNLKNRGLKPAGLKRLVADLRAGDWLVTNQGIGFDKAGHLIDGQHRLTAIIEAGVTVDCLVVMGLDPRAQTKVDRHTRRSLADSLLLSEDTQVAARICEAARADLQADQHIPDPPDSLVARFIDAHYESLEWVAERFRRRIRGISRAPVLAACARYWEIDRAAADRFVTDLIADPDSPAVAPVRVLRAWLTANAGGLSHTNGAPLQFRATRHAIAHFHAGKNLDALDVRYTGSLTDPMAASAP